MKVNVNGAEWMEIYAGVMMYGTCILSVMQTEDGVEVTYSAAPDGCNGETKTKRYAAKSITPLLEKISESEFTITPEDENSYISDTDSDAPSEWCVTFGKGEDTICDISGIAIDDETLVTILKALKKEFPFVKKADEYFDIA